MSGSPEDLRARFRALGDPAHAAVLQGFFQTGPGGYGEGDRFLGIRVPATRAFARGLRGVPLDDVLALLDGGWHEERMLALVVLVERYRRGGEAEREALHEAYLANTRFVDNWDLVDVSAPTLVGTHLLHRDRGLLDRLAASGSPWERRIAVVATQNLIREGALDDTFRLVERLLPDRHDLIHKACGWMLREAGKRDEAALERFLEAHAPRMPRTMLRYAIERLPEPRRKAWLAAR